MPMMVKIAQPWRWLLTMRPSSQRPAHREASITFLLGC